MNKYTLCFRQKQLENEFIASIIGTRIDIYRKVSLIILAILCATLIPIIQRKSIMGIVGTSATIGFNIGQLLYFRRYPSPKCIYILHLFNLIMAGSTSAYILDNTAIVNFTAQDGFVQGGVFMTLHLTLLIDQNFIVNLITFSLITCFYLLILSLSAHHFMIGTLSLLGSGCFLLYTNYAHIKNSRLQFLYKLKSSKYTDIFKQVMPKNYLLCYFDESKLSFCIGETGEELKNKFQLQNDDSFKDLIRSMRIETTKSTIEKHMYNIYLKKQNEVVSNNYFEEIACQYRKIQENQFQSENFQLQLYAFSLEQTTFLLVLHKQTQQIHQKAYQRLLFITQNLTQKVIKLNRYFLNQAKCPNQSLKYLQIQLIHHLNVQIFLKSNNPTQLTKETFQIREIMSQIKHIFGRIFGNLIFQIDESIQQLSTNKQAVTILFTNMMLYHCQTTRVNGTIIVKIQQNKQVIRIDFESEKCRNNIDKARESLILTNFLQLLGKIGPRPDFKKLIDNIQSKLNLKLILQIGKQIIRFEIYKDLCITS